MLPFDSPPCFHCHRQFWAVFSFYQDLPVVAQDLMQAQDFARHVLQKTPYFVVAAPFVAICFSNPAFESQVLFVPVCDPVTLK
uniref:Heat shock transcription factor A4b2 n=1 Tax=Rhizophora mucronata TaxID=61149 RepID=A0A2P2JCF6_RHIMU